METLIHISISELIKKSAKTICYFRKKKKKYEVNDAMIAGNNNACKKTISDLKEMRGTYKHKHYLIHYVFDELQVHKNKLTLIEHKHIKQGSIIEEWYKNCSILQAATYYSFLLKNTDKNYVTANFFVCQGNSVNNFNIKLFEKVESILDMCQIKYKIVLNNPSKFVKFYLKKNESTFNYDDAISWDSKWKFKEFNHLEKYLTYSKLN